MSKKREYSFDILRVIAMIMVIVVHVSNIYSRSFGTISNQSFCISLIFNTFSRISVPLFLMISGALLLDRKFDFTKYKKRLLKYLILIIFWNIIYLIWEYLYLDISYNNLYKLIFDPYRAHLWYLYSILLIYFLQPLMKKILDITNKPFKIILFILWVLFSLLSLFNGSIAEIFTQFSYIGYFIIGKYLYEFTKKFDFKKYNIVFIIIIVLNVFISVYLNYKTSIKYNMFYNLYFAYRTLFIMLSSFSLYMLIISNYKKTSLNKYIISLSSLSLGVYLIHGIFLDVSNKLFQYQNITSLVGIPLFTLFIFSCSVIVVYLMMKNKILNNIIS